MEKVKLGEVFNITSGGTPSRKNDEYYINGNIKWVKTGDLKKKYIETTDECITEKGLENSSAKLYHKDTVLIAMYGATIGAVSILTTDACTNQACAAFSKNEKVIPEYLYYFLKSKKSQFVNDAFGGAQPNISAGYLKSVSFNLLELDEQKNIVNKMNILEKIINTRKKQIDELDELIKSQFVEMFGDPILNNKNWNLNKWNEVLTIKNGRNQKKVEQEDGEYPIYGSGGIMNYANDYICNEDSVIIGRKGNINNPILVRTKFWNVDTAFGLEPCKDKIIVEYLYYFCYFYNFEKHNKAVTIPSLTKTDLLNVDIAIPPIELQNQFANIVKQIDKQKFEIQKSLEETQKLQESLMNQYF